MQFLLINFMHLLRKNGKKEEKKETTKSAEKKIQLTLLVFHP